MSTVTIVLLVILAVLVAGLIVLYFVGKRLQKKQNAQQEQMEATKQTVSILIIDKKKMPLNKSGLPQMAIDQTPKLLRRSKVPIVKAKVGPKIMTLVADEKIFDAIPVKKEVKAVVSGMYIMDVKGLHAPLEAQSKKKKHFWQRVSKAEKELQKSQKEQEERKQARIQAKAAKKAARAEAAASAAAKPAEKQETAPAEDTASKASSGSTTASPNADTRSRSNNTWGRKKKKKK